MGGDGGVINKGKNAKSGGGIYGGAGVGGEYHVGEAITAYKRACAMHGWEVPKEFDEFLTGQPTGGKELKGVDV